MGRKTVVQHLPTGFPLAPPTTPREGLPSLFCPFPSPASSANSTPTPIRRQHLLLKERGMGRVGGGGGKARCAEVAGGTAAGCAAVCCCCPCGLVNLLVLTMVKLPAGLCRKAIRKRRLSKLKAARRSLLASKLEDDNSFGFGGHRFTSGRGDAAVWPDRSPSEEMSEMEKEMWDRFEGTGFWRSPSQRDGY